MEYRQKLQQFGIEANRSGKFLCPQCSNQRKNKSDKCLSVTFGNDSVVYKCHNCGFSGGISYRDKNAKQAEKIYKRPKMPQVLPEKEKVYQYFEGRGISRKTLDKFQISYTGTEIIFPYYKDGELVNLKYRDGKKKFRQESETEKTFYGMDLITDFKQLVICEGEIDVLSFAEAGIEAVSVPQGASEIKLDCIENCFDWLQKFETYVIAVDNDISGDKLKLNLINRLDKTKCKTVNYRQYKDANEVLTAGENLQEIVKNSEYIAPDGIITFYDCIDEILDFKENGYTKGYSTGWAGIDEKFTIKTSYLMVVTGYPSRGKSTFVDNLLLNLSENYGLKHLMASFETTNARHFDVLAKMHTGKKTNTLDNDEFLNTLDFISEHFYRIQMSKTWNIDEIIDECKLAIRKYGIKTLVIDPYNRLEGTYVEREDKFIATMLSKLAMLCKQLDILVIFIAHPKTPDSEKVPTLYNISGGANWYNMCDYGLVIHRERNQKNGELENYPEIHIGKIKDYNIGDPAGGIVELEYRKDKHRIFDKNPLSTNWKTSGG